MTSSDECCPYSFCPMFDVYASGPCTHNFGRNLYTRARLKFHLKCVGYHTKLNSNLAVQLPSYRYHHKYTYIYIYIYIYIWISSCRRNIQTYTKLNTRPFWTISNHTPDTSANTQTHIRHYTLHRTRKYHLHKLFGGRDFSSERNKKISQTSFKVKWDNI